MSSVSHLASPVSQPISNEVATLVTENTKLKQSMLEIEIKLQVLRQLSLSMPVIQHQLEQFISSDSITMHSPDTLESFTVVSVLKELHTQAPNQQNYPCSYIAMLVHSYSVFVRKEKY